MERSFVLRSRATVKLGDVLAAAPAGVHAVATLLVLLCLDGCHRVAAGVRNPSAAAPLHASDLTGAFLPWQRIDPTDGELADLATVRDAIGDAKVVLLGEVHSDGASYAMKTRLVQLLHEQMGFDVLAWEASLSDVWWLRRRFAAVKSVDEWVALPGIPALWSKADGLRLLFEYLLAERDGGDPVELFGIDCKAGPMATFGKPSSRPSGDDVAAELRRMVAAGGPVTAATESAIVAIDELLVRADQDSFQPTREERAHWRQAIDQVATDLTRERAAIEARLGRLEAEYGLQLVRSLLALEEWLAAINSPDSPPGDGTFTNARDRSMVETLAWIRESVMPGHKVIVWTGGFHGLRQPESLAFAAELTGDDSDGRRFRGMVSLAELGRQRWGDELFVVGCTASHGITGRAGGVLSTLERSPASSLEAALDATGAAAGWVTLRSLPADHWLRRPTWARVSGFQPALAIWPEVVDAVVWSYGTSPDGPLDPSIAPFVRARPDESIVVHAPLRQLLHVAGAATIVFEDGTAATSTLILDGPTLLRCAGAFDGDLIARASLTAMVQGALRGTLDLAGPADVEISGGLDPASDAAIVARGAGVEIELGGFTPRSRLERIHGAAAVTLETSDLPVGVQRVGDLVVTVRSADQRQ